MIEFLLIWMLLLELNSQINRRLSLELRKGLDFSYYCSPRREHSANREINWLTMDSDSAWEFAHPTDTNQYWSLSESRSVK